MSSILSIGLRSLIAFQSAIETTSQNLQNARTPFYSRRQVDLVSAMFNGGVEIRDVNRIFDETSNQNLLKSTSALNGVETYLNNIGDLEKLLTNDASNLNKYLNDALGAIQDLSKDVSSPQLRGAYLAKLSSIANQMNRVGIELSARKSDVNRNIESTVSAANDLLTQIADLNSRVGQSLPDAKADLEDQRNAVVHKLAEYFDFTTSIDGNGGINITLQNGLQLVGGDNVNKLSTQIDSSDPSRLNIVMNTKTGSSIVVDSYIKSGQIGGLLNYRVQGLDATEHGLGRLAMLISSTFNAQNKLGMDGYGKIGGDIFNDINAADIAKSRVIPFNNNIGSADMSVTITSPDKLNTSDYELSFTDATHYTLTRLSDHSVVSSGAITSFPASISADGITATINSGTFSAGDSYRIDPMAGALNHCQVKFTDPLKLALGYPVDATANAANNGNGVIKVDKITDTSNASFQTSGQLTPPIKIVFLSDTSYQIINASTNAVMEGPLTYDPNQKNSIFPTPSGFDPGYRLTLSGTVKKDDVFNINYNTNLADNRNALDIAKLYNQPLVENGTMSLNEAYRYTASDISLKTNMAKGSYDSEKIIYQQSETRYHQISGVSDIEEMTNLSEYQQSYQACAEVVQVARSIFDTIVKLMG